MKGRWHAGGSDDGESSWTNDEVGADDDTKVRKLAREGTGSLVGVVSPKKQFVQQLAGRHTLRSSVAATRPDGPPWLAAPPIAGGNLVSLAGRGQCAMVLCR